MDSPTATVVSVPLMTAERFAELIGLQPGVVQAQLDRGYWPTVRVGKRCLINLEAVRLAARQRGAEFTL